MAKELVSTAYVIVRPVMSMLEILVKKLVHEILVRN